MPSIESYDQPLVIIEAPGKTRRLKAFLDDRNATQAIVIATKGRLYDLPESKLGVDITWHQATERTPVNPSTLSYLTKAIAKADSIWILTDNDDEGEWIAEDILLIAEDHSPGTPVLRGYFNALADTELNHAFSSAGAFVPGRAESARARRIFDREIGYLYSSHYGQAAPGEPHGTIGRVITPCLSQLKKGNTSVAHLVREIPDINGGPNCSKAGDAKSLLDQMAALPNVTAQQGKKSDSVVTPSLWNGKEAILNLSRELQRPVQEIANDLESLYLQGKITYPRTESRSVNEQQLQELDRLAKYAGSRGFKSAQLAAHAVKAEYQSPGAHSALIPTEFPHSMSARLESLPPEDQVHLLLTKNTLNAGTEGYQDIIQHGEVIESAELSMWKGWLNKNGLTLQVIRKSRLHGNWREPVSISALDGIVASNIKTYGHSGSRMVKHSPDYLVAKILTEQNLCRTSTLSKHAEKISKLYLDENLQLNGPGLSSIDRAAKIAEQLLNPETARELALILTQQDGQAASDKVAKAMKVARLNPEDRDGKNTVFEAPNL